MMKKRRLLIFGLEWFWWILGLKDSGRWRPIGLSFRGPELRHASRRKITVLKRNMKDFLCEV
jgi:hypothetical protein